MVIRHNIMKSLVKHLQPSDQLKPLGIHFEINNLHLLFLLQTCLRHKNTFLGVNIPGLLSL